jgi:hypothetical protein
MIRKRILVAALLLVVAGPIFFSGVFLVQQKLLQHEMMEKLETEAIQTINISVTDIHWVKKDKEALINGRLFDVKSIAIANNNITLTGLFDTDEDDLMAMMKDATQQNKNNNSPLYQLVVKCLFQSLYNQSLYSSIDASWIIITKKKSTYFELLAEPFCYITTPPPKLS